MKDILKIVIPIIIVAVITFVLCIIFIKPKVLSIKTTKEYEYIQNNKKNIEKKIDFHISFDTLLKRMLNQRSFVEKMVVLACRNDIKAVEIQNFDIITTGFPHSFSTFQQLWVLYNVENRMLIHLLISVEKSKNQFCSEIFDSSMQFRVKESLRILSYKGFSKKVPKRM